MITWDLVGACLGMASIVLFGTLAAFNLMGEW